MIRKILLIVTCFLITLTLFGCKDPEEPPVQTKENVFLRVDLTEPAIKNKKVEFALYEKELKIAKEGNPYDYSYMKVMMEITSPSGKVQTVPAFWFQSTNIVTNTMYNGSPSGINGVASTNKDEIQGLETVSQYGDPHYRVRFTPSESGTYKYCLKIYKNGTFYKEEHEKTFEVANSNEQYKGVLAIDNVGKRSFVFSATNESFVPVGQNTAWYTSTTRKTEDYGVWFKNMKENNMNTARVWLATWGFCLHWGESYTDYTNRVSAIARLDKMVEFAIENDIYFLLTLVNHGQFSSTTNAEWDKNPYNKLNGGPCDNAYDFFTKEEAKEAYKNELMYIIARYGYCNNIFCWELFNEVDWCDNYSWIPFKYKSWHQEMSEFIKTNDPFNHLVSTSYRGTDGNAFSLDTIDFVSPHDYSYTNKNMITNVAKTQHDLASKYNKPVFFGELGLATQNGLQVTEQDPQGITLHQGAWSGIMSGAGGAMNWWWDSYVHPNNLYYRFKGAGAFAKLMNLKGQETPLEQKAEVKNSNIGILGHHFDNRVYGYLFDKSWTYYNTNLAQKKNIEVNITLPDGQYTLSLYDTTSGTKIKEVKVTSSNNQITFNVDAITTDLAFIIE